jgi:glucokinase
MALTVGIDVGGTKIAGGVVDERGNILRTARRESPATDTDAIEVSIEDLVAELRGDHEIAGVGVGAAGFVDSRRSTVLFAPNLAWRDEPLRSDLEKRIGLPVVIENDANAAAWGEFTYGAGEDVDDSLLVTVGTGVGGGIVLNGELHRGAFGVAAEIGHMRVVPGGRICGCGNRGCWEQYASGNALVREARAMIEAGSPVVADLLARLGGDANALTGPFITEAAREGDPTARELLADIGEWLGIGLANLASAFDPGLFVIGGGVSAADEMLIGPAREAFRRQLPGRGYRPEARIVRAVLGSDAGLIGAAELARAGR